MKKLIAIALLVGAQSWAATFNFSAPQTTANIRTDAAYKLVPNFAVDVKSVSAGRKEGVATIMVNGQLGQYDVKVTNVENDGPEVTKSFEAVVKTDVLTRVFCDENESVEYKVTFNETNEYGHYSFIHRVGMEAEVSYTWDNCHSGYDYETYVYSREN